MTRKIVILASGQSNMPQAIPYSWCPEQNVYLWDFNGQTDPSTKIGAGFSPVLGDVIGPAISAANEIARRDQHCEVYVVNIFKGGLPITNWGPSPPSYNFRQAIDGNVPAALASIGVSRIDYCLLAVCESDASNQSQSIAGDVETMLMDWLETKPWFKPSTVTGIFSMTPWAETFPGNGDYLNRRYNGALRKVVSFQPQNRVYIDTDDFPKSLYDQSGAAPYIHRTAEGYYEAGLRAASVLLNGAGTPIPRNEFDDYFTPSISNMVNCSGVSVQWASWFRVGNTVHVSATFSINLGGGTAYFDMSLPIKGKTFTHAPSGVATGTNGEAGPVLMVPGTNTLRVYLYPKWAGAVTGSMMATYVVLNTDQLPNSPPGTT